jgi:glycosyltransferase involved in cell wall biosynthesis
MKNLEENYISAVIVAQNNGETIAGRLTAIHASLGALFKYFEIIVVDNFSSDSTADVLQNLHLPITVITLARLHGVQQALTAGVELAVGDYILEIPNIAANCDTDAIEQMYRVCQQGNDFVFLTPSKTSASSGLFYRIMNNYFKKRISGRFASAIMTLSSRRGQNKTSDTGAKLVNRNVSYVLTGLKCAEVPSSVVSRNRRSLRENIDLMIDTLIHHTDLISYAATTVSLFFFGLFLFAILYSFFMYFTIDTAPGWTSTFILISLGFGVLFVLLSVICKYLSNLIKANQPKSYTFSKVEKKEKI